jgi:hypothetical protein
MKHPIALAAKAAYVELTTVEAKSFFKSTAVEHSLLTMFYFLEAVYWTVEAGRITRGFVDSFSTPKPSTTTIAGLLCPAQDIPPITTEAVVIQSNQQKLEQQITNTLREIQDNVKSNQESDEVSMEVHQISSEVGLEPIPEHVPSEADDHQKTEEAVPTRTRKPRAFSGNRGQSSNKPNPEGRVSGTGSRVQGERHTKEVDV